ncbi:MULTISPECIES: class I SAM-dependent methyltransferase [unclassified Prochlorococcus]|uniref:class I SAM-dependent methyltransferase n=1 Tax=unclassified Prochlorococcus TaxID=2627481 RepID=UPI000533B3E5|nr:MULTISPECIES: methyltransferase domain-containing protein [unclassified Prochlorococcus]KGG14951.1 hypothetical protein EV06_2019 [Prochlorococcus sp. MIT 0602]KGG15615.1 hypothetical protein EV07_1580 [Prochlorococcus sp. MIT 0603]
MDSLKVQYGCGLSNPIGWKNYDSTPTLFIQKIPLSKLFSKIIYKILKKTNPRISANLRNIISNKAIYGDITKRLPERSSSVDFLYASHVLEHLPLKEFTFAIKESYRILKKGGIFRLVVPNLRYFIEEYLDSDSKSKSIDFCLNSNLGKESFENIFSRMRGDGHHLMYDYQTLENELSKVKFSSIRRARFDDSEYSEFKEVEDKNRWEYPENIGFECIK